MESGRLPDAIRPQAQAPADGFRGASGLFEADRISKFTLKMQRRPARNAAVCIPKPP